MTGKTNTIISEVTFKGHSVTKQGISTLKLEFQTINLTKAIHLLSALEQNISVRIKADGKPVYQAKTGIKKLVFKQDATAEIWLETDREKHRAGFFARVHNTTLEAEFKI